MIYNQSRFQNGFTLIELLVVIAIIGTLASVVLASLNSARVKARDATRLAQAREIVTALEMYYFDYNQYPNRNTASGEAAGICTDSGWDDDDCNEFIPALEGSNVRGDNPSGTVYMSQVPTDPIGGDGRNSACGQPGYAYSTQGGSSRPRYTLVIGLEGSLPGDARQCDQNLQIPSVVRNNCTGPSYICFTGGY